MVQYLKPIECITIGHPTEDAPYSQWQFNSRWNGQTFSNGKNEGCAPLQACQWESLCMQTVAHMPVVAGPLKRDSWISNPQSANMRPLAKISNNPLFCQMFFWHTTTNPLDIKFLGSNANKVFSGADVWRICLGLGKCTPFIVWLTEGV